MRFAIYTLGCRLNFAETEELTDALVKEGFEFSFSHPQLIVVRGCSVTKKAEKETEIKIKELKRKEKKSFIIASGCLRKDFFSQFADLIIPKENEKHLLAEIKKFLKGDRSQKKEIKLRTRSFIKIQDGCKNYCSYCLIPYLRGREKSISWKKIIKRIKEKEEIGYREIVLTGVNISRWRNKLKMRNGKSKTLDLVWLIKKILKMTNIPRIRISSIWPNALNKKLISCFKNNRICSHLHLSLQSLSDSLLKKMGRNYTFQEIEDKIKLIRKLYPHLTLTADIIVGFPGENDKEFNKTYKNLKKLDLAKIHVFRYSVREKTAAAYFPNQLEEKIKKKRAKIILSLSNQLNRNWRKKFLNRTRDVLFEQKKDGFWQGLTDNYLKVFVKSKKDLANQILPVKLMKLYQDGIIGKL